MNRSVIETVLGAVVLFVAAFFLLFSYKTANVKSVSGYEIYALFPSLGGLGVGDDVRISGVKIGTIMNITLDMNTYFAKVDMSIDRSVALPTDTAALIMSESLMGGKFMELVPGAEEDSLKPGERIYHIQAPQNLEQLLGKFIFSMQKDGE